MIDEIPKPVYNLDMTGRADVEMVADLFEGLAQSLRAGTLVLASGGLVFDRESDGVHLHGDVVFVTGRGLSRLN